MGTRRLDLEGLLAAASYQGDALRGEDVLAAIASLPHFRGDENALRAELAWPTFAAAVGFVAEVARLAERQNHHPDVDLRHRRVRLELRSHDVDGVSRRDIELAQAVERLLGAV